MKWYEDKIKKHPQYTSAKLVNDLDILYPQFSFLILKLFVSARKEGLPICIYETYRSQERQAELFNKGVTKLKTNGMHHFGIAADLIFLNGKNPSWDSKNNWQRLGTLGQALGLEWGGSWKNFVDLPHFQLIPATVTEQAKIINKNYPIINANINVTNILALYKQAKDASFSTSSIDMLWTELSKGSDKSTSDIEQISEIKISVFTRDLSEGITGEDVKLLQKMLNGDKSTQITFQGVGSPGQESDYFGNLTKKAVQKFQTKYGIISKDEQGYGIVGPLTRKKLEEIHTKQLLI